MEPSDALIVVDVQNDFCPGGALAVPEGDAIIPAINALIPRFRVVVFTRDWHPVDHCSFAAPPRYVDGAWPRHCVANTPGASLRAEIGAPADAIIVDKGTDAAQEAYSGFEGTKLTETLRERGIARLYVCGLATDYCVKHTALDGARLGFEVAVIEDASRGVAPETTAAALDELRVAGVRLVAAKELR